MQNRCVSHTVFAFMTLVLDTDERSTIIFSFKAQVIMKLKHFLS